MSTPCGHRPTSSEVLRQSPPIVLHSPLSVPWSNTASRQLCLYEPGGSGAGGAGGGGGGGGGGGAGGIPAGVTVSGLIITVSLTQQVALTAPGGFLVVTSTTASAIIICLGTNSWKAFTSTCTHQGCTVNSFAANRINCPCHGSQFDTNGSPVAGPAPSPLVQFPLTFDATANTVQVTTS